MTRSSYPAPEYAFAERMLTLRTALRLTQTGLAELLGISRRAVGSWEAGQSYPKPHHLQQFIALCVERQLFPAGRDVEEIGELWQAANQKMLLDEVWLRGVLERQATSLAAAPHGSSQPSSSVSAHHLPVQHNLPRALTPCLGRASESATITRYLSDPGCRLITIVGPGGVGKTRLALNVAQATLDNREFCLFPDGVYVVYLADVEIAPNNGASGADLFATAVADALQFALSGAERPFQQLLGRLSEQRILLVLDNFEHLLQLAPTIVNLLQQTQAVTILATSRALLEVGGEQVVPLAGLQYELPIAATPTDDMPPALRLFQRTASAHAPNLGWFPTELALAASICARVEGNPLAIELAASLVRLLSLQELDAELAASTTVLQTTQRDLAPRQRSLRAVFDHSWRLLSAVEQRALSELSIFRSGFDRNAARAVAGAELPLLATLINHSLIHEAAPGASASRYSLHTLVREHAAAMLTTLSSEAPAHLADRHSHYYLGWVAVRRSDLRGQNQQAAQAAIHGEIDNLRAAWRWAVARSDILALVAAGKVLFHFYEMRSWFQEGADMFQLAAQSCEALLGSGDNATIAAWARLVASQGWLTFHLGRPEAARVLLSRSLALLEPLEVSEDTAFTLNYLAAVTYHTGGYVEAQRLAHAALVASEQVGDQHGVAIAKTILGQIAYLTGAYTEARRWSMESLALEQQLGNRWGTVFTLISLGRVAMALNAYQDARRWFEEGLVIHEMLGDTRGSGLCLSYLGDVAAALGEHGVAEPHYQASLARFRQIHNSAGMALALTKLADIAVATGDHAGAQPLLTEAVRTAWAIQSLPATLDALAVLARALVDDQPGRAADLATLVVGHTAATQHSKHQATLLLERLATPQELLFIQDAQQRLETLMPDLLASPLTLSARHTLR